ncbi:hypothetical protein J2X71_004283 [Rhizobium sp. 1399]|nr:hypothetical protein [Rhizobium sp. 1399]
MPEAGACNCLEGSNGRHVAAKMKAKPVSALR